MAKTKAPLIEYTKVEQRILYKLSDGDKHYREDIKADCLIDDLASNDTVSMHMGNLRKKLKPIGRHIVCEYANRRIHYRLVALINDNA